MPSSPRAPRAASAAAAASSRLRRPIVPRLLLMAGFPPLLIGRLLILRRGYSSSLRVTAAGACWPGPANSSDAIAGPIYQPSIGSGRWRSARMVRVVPTISACRRSEYRPSRRGLMQKHCKDAERHDKQAEWQRMCQTERAVAVLAGWHLRDRAVTIGCRSVLVRSADGGVQLQPLARLGCHPQRCRHGKKHLDQQCCCHPNAYKRSRCWHA